MYKSLIPATLILGMTISSVSADDWPQWLGPNRDSIWRETGIVESIPESGLPVKWRVPINGGYSGSAVAGGQIFV